MNTDNSRNNNQNLRLLKLIDITRYTETLAKKLIVQSDIDMDELEPVIEDCDYESAMSKMESIIEYLRRGYENILNEIKNYE